MCSAGDGCGWASAWAGTQWRYQGLGESFADRGARSEEQIEFMRALWTAPTITYHGRWHHVDNAGIRPLPVRQNIPIWIGGVAETVLRPSGEVVTAGCRNGHRMTRPRQLLRPHSGLRRGGRTESDGNGSRLGSPITASLGTADRLRHRLAEAGRD